MIFVFICSLTVRDESSRDKWIPTRYDGWWSCRLLVLGASISSTVEVIPKIIIPQQIIHLQCYVDEI